MIDIKELRALAADTDDVILTQHVFERIRQRELKKEDLFSIILNGEIIEQYPNDYPFPSCLILGNSLKGEPLHIVCGLGKNKDGKNKAWVITAYNPDPNEWEADLKTRKR